MKYGALILCGGKSSRMGRDKAMLPFGRELMLQRVTRLVTEVIEPTEVIVVAAPDQALPDLLANVQIARDHLTFRGPLQGLATGLHAIGNRVDVVYATGCDVPLLAPAFVRRMFDLLDDFEIVVPFDGTHHHPLAAVYRTSVLSRAEAILDSGEGSPQLLFDVARTKRIPVEELHEVDPNLYSLTNVNREQDYLAALTLAGLTVTSQATDSESRGPAG